MAPKRSVARRGLALVFAGALVLGGLVACGDDGDDAGGGSEEEYCALAAQVSEVGRQTVGAADPAEVERVLKEQYDLVQQAAAVAPEEIRSEVDALVALYGDLISAGDASDWDPVAMQPAAQDFQSALGSGEYDAVSTYAAEHCDIP
ncbi:MAG: hypothetical protein IPM45_16460 [Acidimicrobiales bacterium]|nr:hypothetical protein [Acidimicrobiales bacterium]